MQAVRKAIWFIESHYAEPIGLGEVAEACGMSRFHLARCFAAVTGMSVGRYLRARRLSEAARCLAGNAGDVIGVALDHGYGSHEAFTRAFTAHFGHTPKAVRMSRPPLTLQEPIAMPDTPTIDLAAPEIRAEGPWLFAGLRAYRTFADRPGIPAQWQRFAPYLGNIPDAVAGGGAFGLCFRVADDEEGFDYMCAVPVTSLDRLPPELSGARVAAQRYAVFSHEGHVSDIPATCDAIFCDWLPGSGEAMAEDAPLFLAEHYDDGFDPVTGRGGITIRLPLAG